MERDVDESVGEGMGGSGRGVVQKLAIVVDILTDIYQSLLTYLHLHF